MTDKPIIFSAPMVRALIEGRKVQARLVLKPLAHTGNLYVSTCRWAAGDRIWVRETWQEFFADEIQPERKTPIAGRMGIPARPDRKSVVVYRADGPVQKSPEHGAAIWRSPVHMPRWASRLTLIVKGVRVERLQEISEEGAFYEGMTASLYSDLGYSTGGASEEEFNFYFARKCFIALWNSIHSGHNAWGANPWVCVLTFDVHRCNIDTMCDA